MKRTIVALFCTVLATAAISASAQVVPSATGRKLSVTAGGLGSVFQPDYAGTGIAQTSPNRLYGVGAFVDVRVNRWIQLEAEGHWMRFNPSKRGIATMAEESPHAARHVTMIYDKSDGAIT